MASRATPEGKTQMESLGHDKKEKELGQADFGEPERRWKWKNQEAGLAETEASRKVARVLSFLFTLLIPPTLNIRQVL